MMDGTISLNGNIVGISCTGKRNNNEDALLAEKAGDGYLIAIADGIGGHRAGEVASAIAISTVVRGIFEPAIMQQWILMKSGYYYLTLLNLPM